MFYIWAAILVTFDPLMQAFTLLQVTEGQLGEFVAAKSAGEQQGKQCTISLPLDLFTVRRLPERMCLLCGQPVAEPGTQFLNSLDSPYSRG